MSSTFKLRSRSTTPPPLPSQPLLWEAALEHGAHWSGIVRRGTSLRVTALEAGANVAAMLYNYESLLERYNMADTLKAQHTAYLTAGVDGFFTDQADIGVLARDQFVAAH